MKTPILPKCLVAGSLALLAAGCSDSDDGQQPPNVSVVVANNVADSEGTVDVFAPNLNSRSGSFTSGSNEGIAFDSTGTLFQAGDNATFTGLRVFANFASRADGSAYTAGFDRQLDGAGGLTGGFAGKGIVVIDAIGRVVVADNAAGLFLKGHVDIQRRLRRVCVGDVDADLALLPVRPRKAQIGCQRIAVRDAAL